MISIGSSEFSDHVELPSIAMSLACAHISVGDELGSED